MNFGNIGIWGRTSAALLPVALAHVAEAAGGVIGGSAAPAMAVTPPGVVGGASAYALLVWAPLLGMVLVCGLLLGWLLWSDAREARRSRQVRSAQRRRETVPLQVVVGGARVLASARRSWR